MGESVLTNALCSSVCYASLLHLKVYITAITHAHARARRNGTTAVSGQAVSTWYDKSTSALNMQQTNVTAQPVVGFDTSGFPFLLFNANSVLTNAFSHTGNGGRTVFVVWRDMGTSCPNWVRNTCCSACTRTN